jgi:hypothetical protein
MNSSKIHAWLVSAALVGLPASAALAQQQKPQAPPNPNAYAIPVPQPADDVSPKLLNQLKDIASGPDFMRKDILGFESTLLKKLDPEEALKIVATLLGDNGSFGTNFTDQISRLDIPQVFKDAASLMITWTADHPLTFEDKNFKPLKKMLCDATQVAIDTYTLPVIVKAADALTPQQEYRMLDIAVRFDLAPVVAAFLEKGVYENYVNARLIEIPQIPDSDRDQYWDDPSIYIDPTNKQLSSVARWLVTGALDAKSNRSFALLADHFTPERVVNAGNFDLQGEEGTLDDKYDASYLEKAIPNGRNELKDHPSVCYDNIKPAPP